MKLSLSGKKILVTREASQSKQFSAIIKQAQGLPIEVPLLKIECRKEIDHRLELSDYNWIFFTSAHGVRCFFQAYAHNKATLTRTYFATVGHKTENALKEVGFKADFIPSTYNAEVMAKEFFALYPDANNILLVRGNLSRKLLVEELTRRRLIFDTTVLYDTIPYKDHKAVLLNKLENETIDFLTFTSPSTVKTFMEMVEQEPIRNKVVHIPCVCIGTTTEKTAQSFSFSKTIVPITFTIESMVESMIEFIRMEGSNNDGKSHI